VEPRQLTHGVSVFQGEPMHTYWLEGRKGMPEFDFTDVGID